MVQQTSASRLGIIRIALVVTVVVFAAFAHLHHQHNHLGAAEYLPLLVAVVALGLVFYFREQAAAAATSAQAESFTIVAWALGEGAALTGWVFRFLGGSHLFALPGTLVFLLAILLVPVPRER